MTFATVTSVTFVIMSNVGKLGGFHIPFANLATWACVERNIGAVTSRILFNEKWTYAKPVKTLGFCEIHQGRLHAEI